jgi:hypothetical protein
LEFSRRRDDSLPGLPKQQKLFLEIRERFLVATFELIAEVRRAQKLGMLLTTEKREELIFLVAIHLHRDLGQRPHGIATLRRA